MADIEIPERNPLKKTAEQPLQAKAPKPVGFFQLFRFATKKDKILMFVGTIAGLLNGAAIGCFALLFGDITDVLATSNDLIYDAGMVSLQFLGVAIGIWLFSYIAFTSWTISGENQGIRIRTSYFRSLLRQEIAFFDSINPNELSGKIAAECFDIQGGIGEKVVTFVNTLAMLITGFVIGYVKGWQLALILTALFPFIFMAGSLFVYANQKTTTFTSENYAKAGGISEEALNAIKTVASLSGEEKEAKRYKDALTENIRAVVMFAIFSGVAMGLLSLMDQGIFALGFGYGTFLIDNQTINAISDMPYTGGDILTVLFSIMYAGYTISLATPSLKKVAQAKAAAATAFPMIDRQSKISIESKEGLKPAKVQGYIEFKDVTFAYPLKPDRVVLSGTSFKANRGEKVALVGESGCGKTTCLQLIERFYDCDNGSVTIDGNDVRSLNLRWLRENIAYVGQEPVLFATSIKENLLIAKEDATEDELWQALRRANAADFVSHLPHRLDTFVGNNATQLSGGQKQRLAIARAILKNPSILILDEATSALDRKNEREIQKTLDEISDGRTTISIAHRLTTIQNADRIIVFEKGRVAEEGKHEELVAKRGVYYALQHLQLQNQEEDKEPAEGTRQNILTTEGDIAYTQVQLETLGDEETKLKPQSSHNPVKISSPIPSNDKKPENIHQDNDAISIDIRSDQAHSTQKLKNKEKAEDDGVTMRLLVFNKEKTLTLIIGLIFAGLNGTIFPLSGLVLAEMLGVYATPFAPDFHKRAVLYSIYFVILSLGALVCYACQITCFNLVGENLSKNLRIAVFKKYLVSEIGWYDRPENAPGVLIAKLAKDASLVNTLASTLLGVSVQALSSFITGCVIAFVASWQLTLVSLAVSPLSMVGGMIESKVRGGQHSAGDEAYRESASFVSEAVNNMRTVASFGREDKILKNYEQKLQEPAKAAVKRGSIGGFAFGFSQFSPFFVFAVIFIIGAVFRVKIGLGYKELFQSVMGIFMASYGVGYAMQYAPDVGAAKVAAISIFKILDRQPAIRLDDPAQTITTPIKGDIEFKNVWFRYPTRPKDILRGVSFKINAASKVALVGTSGCGKSTIMALLMRFYDPTQGEILIDGIDIKRYDLRHLRKTFGVVSQEPTLFNGTIEYNIRYNEEKATFDQIRQAAAEANALGFIEKNEFDDLPNTQNNSSQTGFNKQVGPKGSQISGGQKQRIAIARAILKKPSVLLLDEATSALDAQSEKVVQESLDKIMEGKTAIIIAHRMSTIRTTDEILVFNEGQVIERGNYEQLVQQKGVFYKLEQGLDMNA